MSNPRSQSKLIASLLLCSALALGCMSGCGRTVRVHEDTPMRLAGPVKARVEVPIDGVWTMTPGTVVLPEGYYIVPPRFVEPGDFE